jgi:cyclic pyranopterin phosphate synthase
MNDALTDLHGRRMRKLRVSLTDACNFRCFYCMPENAVFLPHAALMRPAEYERIVGGLVALGLGEVRLTGGEPTIRPEFEEIVERFSRLPLTKLGLTTNGKRLGQKLDFLQTTAVRHINVSLDSLDAARFAEITHSDSHAAVVAAVLEAKARGFSVKVNVVVARGVNDHEAEDFVAFSERYQIPVRFLELMKIGPRHAEHGAMFVSAAELLAKIEGKHGLTRRVMRRDSTSFNYRTAGGGEVGFIASESKPFCADCSRLRLSATGVLRACLMSEDGLPIRDVPIDEYPALVSRVVAMKPTCRIAHIDQAMHSIGG